MNRLVTLFFSALLLPLLARLTHALLRPVLRALALDPAQLATALTQAGQVLTGATPTYVATGDYTATDMQDIAESLAELLAAVPGAFRLVVPRADLGRLCEAVAARIDPAASA